MSLPKIKIKLNQMVTSDPTIQMNSNETGSTFTVTRVGVGQNLLVSTKAFSDFFSPQMCSSFFSTTTGALCFMQIGFADSHTLGINTMDATGTLVDDVMGNVPIEIDFIGMDELPKVFPVNTSDSEPTTTDIPDGHFAGWLNTTTGYLRIISNVGGDLDCALVFKSGLVQTLTGGEPTRKPSAGA